MMLGAHGRLQAMQALARHERDDLFYSSVYSLSRPDSHHLRALIVDFIERADPMLVKSPEEEMFCLSMDFFKL